MILKKKKKEPRRFVFAQLIIGFITGVICAVMMQDQSPGDVLASNHTYYRLLCTFFVTTASFENAIAYSKTTCVECVFGDTCVAELLMQCKSNLPHGRCGVCCLLCVFVFLCVCV